MILTNDVTIHVRAKDHASRDVDRVGSMVGTKLRNSLNKHGAHSGAAFMAGFIKTITLGQVGSGFAQASMKLAPRAAHFGGVLGVGMATGLVMKLSSALTALMPLALGAALAAGPVVFLMKGMLKAEEESKKIGTRLESLRKRYAAATDKDVKKRLKDEMELLELEQHAYEQKAKNWYRLKNRARDFMAEISKPFEKPLAKSMEAIGDGLDRIKKPLTNMMKELAPALEPFTKGVMKGIENFIKEIEPHMPAIADGFAAWGDAAANIGKSMGKFIATIMKDPEGTVQAVKDLATEVGNLATAAGDLVSTLSVATTKYNEFAEMVDRWEGKLDGDNVLLPKPETVRKHANAVVRAYNWFKNRIGEAIDSFKEKHAPIAADVRRVWNRVVSTVRNAASRVVSAVTNFARGVKRRFAQVVDSAQDMRSSIARAWSRIVADVRNMMNRFVTAIRNGANRAITAVRNLKNRIVNFFANAGAWLVSAGRRLISGFVSGARAAAAGAGGAILGAIRSVIPDALEKYVPGLAHGGYVGARAGAGGPRGGQVLVGEQGPEIVTLPYGSKVHSNADSKKMGMGGPMTIIVDLGRGIQERFELSLADYERGVRRAVSAGRSGY